MVLVAQLVRASLCGSEGREFEPRQAPILINVSTYFTRLIMNIEESTTEIYKAAQTHNLEPQVLMGKLHQATPGENTAESVIINREWLIQTLGKEKTDRLLAIWVQFI